MDDHAQPDNTLQTSDNLSVHQEIAIDLLILGLTDQHVAQAVNVRRETVCNWRNHNPAFSAELSRRRQEHWGSHAERLQHIAATALDVLAADLTTTKYYPTEADRRIRQAAAVQVLKAAGFYRQAPPPPAQPAAKPEIQAQTPEHQL